MTRRKIRIQLGEIVDLEFVDFTGSIVDCGEAFASEYKFDTGTDSLDLRFRCERIVMTGRRPEYHEQDERERARDRGRQHSRSSTVENDRDEEEAWEKFRRTIEEVQAEARARSQGAAGFDERARERRRPSGPWWDLLGRPKSYSEARAAFKKLALVRHPDHGGTAESFLELTTALEDAKRHWRVGA